MTGLSLAPTPADVSHDEGLAWATLDALGVTGRAATEIANAGGPIEAIRADPLWVWALREGSRLRRGREAQLPLRDDDKRLEIRSRIAVARKKAATLRPFLDAGGTVRGGVDIGRLLQAKSPPLCVYAAGAIELLSVAAPMVAMVGTRIPTARGEARAHQWARQLAAHGVVVVSGGARGIDCAAHAGAVNAGGNTLVVLGDSVNILRRGVVLRPRRVQTVFDGAHASSRALSFTASGPWVAVSRSAFVSRNRLVAALSDLVLVLEAGEGSGALHTVDDALALGTPVCAIPGDPDCPQSRATNAIIADGRAQLVTTPDDVLRVLGIAAPPARPAAAPAALPPLLQALANGGGLAVDDLVAQLGRSTPDVLDEVLGYELEGRVLREGARLVFVR